MAYSKKNLLKAIAVFMFVLAGSGLIIWFIFLNFLESTKTAYEDARLNLMELEQKAGLRNELRDEFSKVSGKADTIKSSFLTQEGTLGFIEGMESLAASTQTDYEVKVAQEIRDPETSKITAINFNINIAGTHIGLLQFLRGVKEDLPYLTQVTNIVIDRNSPDVLKTTLTIKVFMQ
ncbi:MAG: hypothetical protein WD712_02915 [Candidatus Spechtbacterales bacterium]